MKLENGKLVLENRKCWSCNEGRAPGKKLCPTCKGTGKGKRGGKGGCRDCYGNKTRPDFENTVVCGACDGTNSVPEDLTDTLPSDIWRGLTFKVIRKQAGMSFNESYIGAGCVFSCVDYGKAWNGSDERAINEVKSHDSNQACKVVRDDGTICDHIEIAVKPGGYAVRAVFAN